MPSQEWYIEIPPTGGSGGVSSLNGLLGAVDITAGSGISVAVVGNDVVITNTGGGSGTVTSVSVVSANGFGGTVATPTTTPAITLTSSVSGILFGNGTGVAAAIAANFPTLNQNTTGTASNITASSNSSLTTLSSLSLPGAQVTGNISGNAANITATSNSTLTTLSSLSLPGTQVTGNISGNAANITATSNSTLTTLSSLSLPGTQVTGNISGSAGAVSGTNVVTNSNLSQMPTLTIKGNNTGSTANASDLTVAQVNAILPVFTGVLNGLVPGSGGGTSNFLRADGGWDVPPGTSTGTVSSVSVVSANGLAGTVATATTTPAITLSTTITGLLKGNGTAISAQSVGNLTDPGTDGIAVTGGTGAVLGSGTSIAQQVATTSQNGYMSASNVMLLNSKLSSIPDVQTAYVNGGGNDATGMINRIDLPFLTIAGAMASFTDLTVINQILIQTPGTFSIDGLNWLANVFIVGISSSVTTIDFGASGFTFDASWTDASTVGGFTGATLTGTSAPYTVNPPAGNTFYFQGCTFMSGLILSGSGSSGTPLFFVESCVNNSGYLNLLDANWLAFGYFSFGSQPDTFTCDTASNISYLLGCTFVGGLSVVGSTGTASVFAVGGSSLIVSVTGSSGTLGVTNGFLPSFSSITITSGGTLLYIGDAFGIGYTAGTPGDWAGTPPNNVQSALDRIAAVVGGITPIP